MSTPTIENIIVVMLENRSYDNLLGGLYLASNAAPYNAPPSGQAELNGLANSSGQPGNYSNPNPNSPGETIPIANQTAPTQVGGAGTYYPPTAIPLIDPGEFLGDMAWQITGSQQSTNPYSTWPPSSTANLMQGFTDNYANQIIQTVPSNNIPDVMNYFTPSQVPVSAWLANNFGVCDQWFASVPTQTFTNRAFSHCAAPVVYQDGSNSYSLVDDAQYVDSIISLPSIFSELDAAYSNSSTPNWKVYFHDYCITMLTVPYVMNAALSSQNRNVATYDRSDWGTSTPQPITSLLGPGQSPLGAVPSTFMEDLENGTLPMYSVIEPRYSNGIIYQKHSLTPYSYPANSNHPGGANYPTLKGSPVGATNPPIDVADGEAFLKQLYNALQQSSYWNKTLLIITYDEHGGCFDHVAPPAATPPGQTTNTPSIAIPPAWGDVKVIIDIDIDPPANGFGFNVYGCRVPAIIVSPYISAGSRITPTSGTFDHASIIRTVWDIFFTNAQPPNPPAVSSLTQRDAEGNAASLYPSLDFSIFNNPGQL